MAPLRSSEERLFACALPIEHDAAQKHGNALLVGIACKLLVPAQPVVSFGFAGALCGNLPVGTVVDATKVVDEEGQVLWEGKPLGVPGAYTGIILGTNRFIDSAEERSSLCMQSGADAVDMESGIYARENLLTGCVRVISDTPTRQLGAVSKLFTQEGKLNYRALMRMRYKPNESIRAIVCGYAALRALKNLTF